jgi:hypothetical protein
MEIKFDLKNVLTIAAVIGLLTTSVTAGYTFYSTWKDIPSQVTELTQAVQTLVDVVEREIPQIVDFVGGGILSDSGPFKAGDSPRFAYTLRRNVSCPTDILVRFYDHESGTINNSYSYIIPEVQSPVTRSFAAFSVPIRLPKDLPAGKYSYFPEIIPLDCGVYRTITPPMSEAFYVVDENDKQEL